MVKGVHHVADGAPQPATAGAIASTDCGLQPATAGAISLPDGAAPEWIKLFDYGTYTGRDGRGPYILRDQAHASQVIAATTAYQKGADLPIDYDHQTQLSRFNGQPAIASGWIKQLEARADGVYGRVEWTAPATQHIEAKEFRYVSPTFWGDGPNSTGNVTRIVGAALTNLPNFTLPAIASQTQGVSMDPEQLKALALALGLPATASQSDVLAAAKDLKGGLAALCKIFGISESTPAGQLATAAQAAILPLATALKADATTALPALATAAQQIAGQQTEAGKVDLTKYVPMDVHLGMASQLSALQGKVATTDAERAVEDAIKAGKVTPAQKEWAVAMANQSLPAFQDYVKVAPVIVNPATAGGQTTIEGTPAGGQQQLTAEDIAVASQMGMSEDEFLKAKKEVK